MHKKEKMLAVLFAILMIVFGFLIWYFNVYKMRNVGMPASYVKPVTHEVAIPINNTLKTSVTVLPTPDNQAVPQP
jgi:hypothetical protein